MSAVDRVGQVMTPERARALTDRIKDTLSVAYDALIECWQGRADQALGYESWDAYCATEFAEARMVRLARDQRQEIVAQMRSAGMSTRAIGSGLGIGAATAMRDTRTAGVSDETPDATVIGLNGQRRPAARPQPASTPDVHDINAGISDSAVERDRDLTRRALPAIALGSRVDELLESARDPDSIVRDCPPHARDALARVPKALHLLTQIANAMETYR